MSPSFGKQERPTHLQEMTRRELDLLVIGGGITGCGIALDAALRGLHVGLIEMQDFSAGTSSRSTKLIHGGLRYLKQGDLKLVREVGRERRILYQRAPHLIQPLPMLLPLYRGGTYGRLSTSIGLWIYDRLAAVTKAEQHHMLSKEETIQLEPLLKKEGLIGGGVFIEYQTDDARLTIEVIKTAVSKGAWAVNYTQAKEFIYDHNQVTGVLAEDRLTNTEYIIKAKQIINATGPWVDHLRELDNSKLGKRLHLTKGVHIIVARDSFPLGQAVYFDVSDGRMIFAIPRENNVYIGTTDTDYRGDLSNPSTNEADLEYLLAATRAMFPTLSLRKDDILTDWAGLRPLIHQEGKLPSELSRKDELLYSPSGMISIAGGKLTGFRVMAEKVVDVVVHRLEAGSTRRFSVCQTASQVLSGGDVGGVEKWASFLQEKTEQLLKHPLLERNDPTLVEQAIRMVKRYGSNIDQVLTYLNEIKSEPVILQDGDRMAIPPLLLAELLYCRDAEMAVLAEDFLRRRTDLALFNRQDYHKYSNFVDMFFSGKII